MNKMHAANAKFWDALAPHWESLRDQDQLWRRCAAQPDLAFDGGTYELINATLGDLHGKCACVIASGDNYAAFALAGMGAKVTSVDISERQLEIANRRAKILGLEIHFVQTDAADLTPIGNAQCDLVCSSNGLYVWIADPGQVFAEVYRVLKPGGYYIFYDIHPFLRPWKDQRMPLEMEKPYPDTGPFESMEAGQTIYEFHWRLCDLINPLLDSGLQLRRMVESPPKDSRFWQDASYLPGDDLSLLDWRSNPRAGLPVWLALAAQKPVG